MGSEPGTSGTMFVPESYDPGEDDALDADEPMSPGIMANPCIRSNVKFDQCYEVCNHMEDGKFGKVYRVKNKLTNREFAAKFIKIKKLADKEGVEKEVSILCSLRHSKIAQIYDAFYTVNNEVVLIMEIVRGGELFKRVADDNYVLTEQAVAIIIWQLCEAIEFIHSKHIIHLDLKPENIMCVSETGNKIKLIDFGLAQFYDGSKEVKYLACTPEFGAPEVITFENLSFHTDMWSVGVITYLLLSGYSPFLGDNDAETYTNVERGVWEFTEEFDAFTPEAKDFISKLLIKNPKERMLPAACLAHPWITLHRAKALAAANSAKPVSEGAKIDNRLMRRYNARRRFRQAGYQIRFLISMMGLRKSLRARNSENGFKFFEPLFKEAEKREKQLAMIENALLSGTPAPKPLGDFSGSLPVSLSKKRASLATDSLGNVVLGKQEKEEKEVKKLKDKSTLPPKVPTDPSKPLEEGAKNITKTVVDPVTGEVKIVKKKSIKKKKEVDKTSEAYIGNPSKKGSLSLEAAEAGMKKLSLVHVDSAPVLPATTGTVAKKKSLPTDINAVSVTSVKRPSLANSDGQSSESSSTRKSLTFVKPATDKKSSITSESSVHPSPKKICLSSETPATPKKKKSVVLVEPTPTPLITETKTESLLSVLKKRKSLPTEIPLSISEEKKEILRKQSLHTEKPVTTKSAETIPKEKSLVNKEAPAVELKVHEQKEKLATVTEAPKKRRSLVAVSETAPLVLAKSENLIGPKMEKKVTKSESSDSHKENREQEEKKPIRQGAVKKKEKVDDGVLNLVTTKKSVDSSSSQSIVTKDAEKMSETAMVRKKLSLKSTGEKDKVDDVKVEATKDEKKTESLIKARLSKLNSEAPPLSFNIMSVAQKNFPVEEKKSATTISMTPEKVTTTTTSTTTSVKKKSSITEKKVQLSTAAGKTVEQVEKTNSTQDKVKVSQITTKREESPELETPLTSVEKRVVKQNSLKAMSEKLRKEEEKTKDGTIVQISKILNDKTLNHTAVNQQTTAPSGTVKKISLSHTNEVNKKIEGKAEAEVTPKTISLKRTDITVTEKAKSTVGADVNGNKTVLQKTHKTEIKITPTQNGETLIKVDPPKDAFDRKRSSILTVPKLIHRDSSEERKTVRFAGDVNETLPPTGRPPMPGLQKINSEGALYKKVHSSLKVEEKVSQDDGAVKKQKRLLKSAQSEDTFTPKDEFSFDNLKEALMRRLTPPVIQPIVEQKDCVPVAKTYSVKDRLRQFQKK